MDDIASQDLAAGINTNPFCTSRVRPGAIPFVFPPGESLERLIGRLQERAGRGQILGPHGSGKSTLLASLIVELERRGGRPVLVTIQGGQRRLPLELDADSRLWDPHAMLIVDGYEQLSWFWRWRVRRFCRRRGLGLIVTAHRDVGMPTLLTLAPEVTMVQSLVRQLAGDRAVGISDADLADSLTRLRGNVRELFMELYDRCEELTPSRSG